MAIIPKIIKQELDQLPKGAWKIERGGKHMKIYVHQKFVGILPSNGRKDSHGGRGGLNVASNIKRLRKG